MDSAVAVIELGGKQHLVKTGAKVVVNRLASNEGDTLNLADMLSGQAVQAKVVSHQLGKKINGLKFKAKTRYMKHYGHRQTQTLVEVVSIGAPAIEKKTVAPKVAAKKPVAKKPVQTAAKKVKNG